MMNDQPAEVNPIATGNISPPAAAVNPPVAPAPIPMSPAEGQIPVSPAPIQNNPIPVQPSPIASSLPGEEVPKKKKSILKILLSLFLVVGLLITAAVAIAYFTLLKPASPEKICENFFAVTKQELKKQLGTDVGQDEIEKMLEEDLGQKMGQEECIEDRQEWLDKVKNSPTWGILTIAQSSKCQASAKTLLEFTKCEDSSYIKNDWGKTSNSTEEIVEEDEVVAEVDKVETTVAPTQAAVDNSSEQTITFEQTINVNDVVEFMFQIKDEDQSYEGKGSIKVTELGQSEDLASSGDTLYFTIYEFKGDITNHVGESAQPLNMQDIFAPQVVLLKEDSLPSIGGSYGGAYDSDLADLKGLEYKFSVKLNNPDWVKMGNTWSKKDHPSSIVAIQYHDLTGNKKYIKVNFKAN